MSEVLEDKCGLVLAYTLHDAYAMIKGLQHRGKEAAGIAAVGDSRIDVLKWVGRVDRFDRENLHKIFPSNNYNLFFAHVRYATRGRKEAEQILRDAHPHTIGGTVVDHKDHILIIDCDMAMVHNGEVNVSSLEGVVGEELKTQCDTEAFLHYYKNVGERQILQNIEGAYTAIIADKKRKEVMVIRDPLGMRPGVIGLKGNKHCVASEDVAIRANGGKRKHDLWPGRVYLFDAHGEVREDYSVSCPEEEEKRAHCFFEYQYLASPESLVDKVSVQVVRELLGEQVAAEVSATDFDFVTYIPNSPEAAAHSCAKKLNLPLMEVFYKPEKDRSFMSSTKSKRESSIENNLFFLYHVQNQVQGKRGLIIDDSTIRGTVGSQAHRLLKEAGVASATLFSYTPPVGVIGKDGIPRGCIYGVDMPPQTDENHTFIARIEDQKGIRNATLEEISNKIGMPVKYLSLQGLQTVFEKVGLPLDKLCTYCIGGKEPFQSLVQLRRK